MSQRSILHVIVYDISDNKQRGRVARRLEKRATRVQYSVFEAHLTRNGARRLGALLGRYLDAGDSLRMYPVVNRSVPNCLTLGAGAPPHAGDYWIV